MDPDLVRAELRALGGFTGNRDVDVHHPAILACTMDPEAMEKERLRRHVFLGRHGKQPVTQWQEMESRLVRRYAEALADLLREESKAMAEASKAKPGT